MLLYTSPLHVQQVRENIMGGKHERKTSLSVVVDLEKARCSVPGEGRSWRRDCDVLEAELAHHMLSQQQKPCQMGERLAGGGDGRVRAPNQRAREARLCGAGPGRAALPAEQSGEEEGAEGQGGGRQALSRESCWVLGRLLSHGSLLPAGPWAVWPLTASLTAKPTALRKLRGSISTTLTSRPHQGTPSSHPRALACAETAARLAPLLPSGLRTDVPSPTSPLALSKVPGHEDPSPLKPALLRPLSGCIFPRRVFQKLEGFSALSSFPQWLGGLRGAQAPVCSAAPKCTSSGACSQETLGDSPGRTPILHHGLELERGASASLGLQRPGRVTADDIRSTWSPPDVILPRRPRAPGGHRCPSSPLSGPESPGRRLPLSPGAPGRPVEGSAATSPSWECVTVGGNWDSADVTKPGSPGRPQRHHEGPDKRAAGGSWKEK